MVRSFFILVLSSVLLSHAFAAQRGALDPAFERIPFDRWLSEPGQASFRWTASVSRAELSFHQRLMARLDVRVDGRDLQNRRGHGQLVFFIQFADRDGIRYQDDGAVELSQLDKNVKATDLEYSLPAFFLPGEYRFAIAILDTATGEHSTRQGQFRVPGPRHDNFLMEWWRDLPPVELIGKEAPADDSYLPGIHGRLQWAAAVHSPSRLDVVLTAAPSLRPPGLHSTEGDLSALVPTLKVLSETGSPSVSEEVELLDLARRRSVFHQSEVHDLDWRGLKASLTEANTASIDVHSLSDRHRGAQFFVSQLRRVLRASQPPSVLVVLSKPIIFESGEDLEPISLEGLPACRVVYIRYGAPAPFLRAFDRGMHGRGLGPMSGPIPDAAGGGPMGRISAQVVDQLEPTLKPLNPKVFDVETPEQMTKALAEVEQLLLGGAPRSSKETPGNARATAWRFPLCIDQASLGCRASKETPGNARATAWRFPLCIDQASLGCRAR